MKKNGEERHREIICELEEMVRDQYHMTMTEVLVRDPETGNVVGEIDLVGILDSTWDIYEVKCSRNRKKARRQLRNLRAYLSDCGDINLYYYSGREKQIVEIK